MNPDLEPAGRRRRQCRYEVVVCGLTVSQHRTKQGAIRAAQKEARSQGLVDDGAYCGDDGWPAILDTIDGGCIDW